MSGRGFGIRGFGLALALSVVFGCAGSTGPGPSLPAGRVIYRLQNLDGSELSLTSLRGRPVVVTVISTWADPALVEVPRYKALHQRYQDRLAILCVVLDEDPAMARIFQESFDIPYGVVTVADRPGFTGEAGPFGPIGSIPTSVLLDAEGRIAARMDGMWDPNLLEEAVARLLPPAR